MNNTGIQPDNSKNLHDLFVEMAEVENTISEDGDSLLYSEAWKNFLKEAATDDNKKAMGYVTEMLNSGYKPMFYIPREEYDRMKDHGVDGNTLQKKKITIGRPPLTPSNQDYVLVMINDVDFKKITPNTRTGKEEIFQGVIGITSPGFSANELTFVDPNEVQISEREGISYYNPHATAKSKETREEVNVKVHTTMGPEELNKQLREAEDVVRDQHGEVLYAEGMKNLFHHEEIDEVEDAEDMIDDLLNRGYRPVMAVPRNVAEQINDKGFSNQDFAKYIITIGRKPAVESDDYVLIKINNVDVKNIIPQLKSGEKQIFQGRVDINAASLSPEDVSIIDPKSEDVDELDGVYYVE